MKRSMLLAIEAWVAVAIIGALLLMPRFQRQTWDWMTGRPSPDERLIVAAASGDTTAFHAAIADGATARGRDPRGVSALMMAASTGNQELTRSLLAMGAEIDAADLAGETPLMFAAQNDHPDLVRLLLQNHADPARQNHLGQTALDVAVTFHSREAEAALATETTGHHARG